MCGTRCARASRASVARARLDERLSRSSTSTLARMRRRVTSTQSSFDDDSTRTNAFDAVPMKTLETALRVVERARFASTRDATWSESSSGAAVCAPKRRAWAFVHFVGGAALGAVPRVAYEEVLERCCATCGVVVVATPYELGNDHDAIAVGVRERFQKAKREVCEREQFDERAMPVFRVGHSLGCKLLVVGACDGAEEDDVVDVDAASGSVRVRGREDGNTVGYFLMAFNNASASDTVMLVEKFARALLKTRAGENAAAFDFLKNLPSIAAFAERAAKAAGFEFKPSPEETLARVRARYSARKTRLLSFRDDELDQNVELAEALKARFAVYPGTVDTREIEGNHLTPVYFTIDASKLSPGLERVLSNFSLGDDAGVGRLADALNAWILGKD